MYENRAGRQEITFIRRLQLYRRRVYNRQGRYRYYKENAEMQLNKILA